MGLSNIYQEGVPMEIMGKTYTMKFTPWGNMYLAGIYGSSYKLLANVDALMVDLRNRLVAKTFSGFSVEGYTFIVDLLYSLIRHHEIDQNGEATGKIPSPKAMLAGMSEARMLQLVTAIYQSIVSGLPTAAPSEDDGNFTASAPATGLGSTGESDAVAPLDGVDASS